MVLFNWKRNIKYCNTTRDIQILLIIRICNSMVFQMSKQNEYVRKIVSLFNVVSFLSVLHHVELRVY